MNVRSCYAVIFCLALVISNMVDCSSKSSAPTQPPQTTTGADPSILTLNTPDKALLFCGEEYPAKACAYTTLVKKHDSLFNHLSPTGTPADSVIAGDSAIYTWTSGQLTAKLVRYDTSSTYSWRVVFDGNRYGIDYADWTYIEATEKRDRSVGWMRTIEKDVNGTDYRWDWTTSNNQVTVNIAHISDSGMVTVKMLLNADKTGYIEYYVSDVIRWKVDWENSRPSCGGLWYLYRNGVMVSSGSWGYSGS
ncbi:MAG TPA: hypothetical protein VMS71_06695 [Candidatus Acidoferrum sp.]|nr:hypothetical protein [Candidatus Acidoferrum sp.]